MTDHDSASADARFDIMLKTCPTRQVVTQIGGRWSLLIITALEHRSLRFNQLKKTIEGVSQKVLTQNLRTLERDGIVARRVFHTNPVTVEYSLTELGTGLVEVIRQLREWAYGNMDAISLARQRYDGQEHDQKPTAPISEDAGARRLGPQF
jgi:DNA-binding HxlR family transcriptional regulator